MRTVLIVLAVALVSALAAAEQPLTNADIVKLVKAGVSADVIIAKIQSSETAFSTDTDSLVALANEKVPNPVIQAMMARTGAAPTATSAAPPAAQASPAATVTQVVVKGLYRTRGLCTARGDVTMTAKTFAFKPTDKSPLCSEEAFGQSAIDFAWDDVSRLCFEYAASGAVQVWLKNGQDMSFKATRAEIEDLAGRMSSLRPNLPIRCDD
ncbi:MAG TPA: hypothetical protein VMT19_11205 [Thermoanaerobaculaceae bacterium]|nr:hypothetical protein [Thermoanaerobaculaceae bacterium]